MGRIFNILPIAYQVRRKRVYKLWLNCALDIPDTGGNDQADQGDTTKDSTAEHSDKGLVVADDVCNFLAAHFFPPDYFFQLPIMYNEDARLLVYLTSTNIILYLLSEVNRVFVLFYVI